jgi:hypothetical protein
MCWPSSKCAQGFSKAGRSPLADLSQRQNRRRLRLAVKRSNLSEIGYWIDAAEEASWAIAAAR